MGTAQAFCPERTEQHHRGVPHPVGAEYCVTSCDLGIFMDQVVKWSRRRTRLPVMSPGGCARPAVGGPDLTFPGLAEDTRSTAVTAFSPTAASTRGHRSANATELGPQPGDVDTPLATRRGQPGLVLKLAQQGLHAKRIHRAALGGLPRSAEVQRGHHLINPVLLPLPRRRPLVATAVRGRSPGEVQRWRGSACPNRTGSGSGSWSCGTPEIS